MRGLEFLTLDMTHRCNLNCSHCGKFSDSGTWEMSDNDLDLFLQFAPLSPAKNLRITGGDPLTHPKFREYVTAILTLIDKPIELATNGLWLPKYQDMISLFKAVHITDYGDKNRWATSFYGMLSNVNILHWSRYFDREGDPHWTPEQARELGYNRCCLSQANVVGDRVFGCCVVEAIVRHNNLDPDLVSVPLDAHWVEAYQEKDMIAACQHCFTMADVLKNGNIECW
jgi:hypothetical protein